VKSIFLFFLLISQGASQTYDLVFKGGHVIDPANQIDGSMDVAISGNKISRVAPQIPASEAQKIVDVTGLYVTPGLVDIHTHAYGAAASLLPDDTALTTGTTTEVDAGGSGWRNFDDFRSKIISKAQTRVLVLINIVGGGMVDTTGESKTEDMDPVATANKIMQNRDVIVGIKTAHFAGFGWTAIDRAVEAGRRANVPVMVDDHIFTNSGRSTREKVLDRLRPGDIHTHMYNDRQLELVDRFTGKVQPYMLEARKRGLLFDMGHGAGSFLWPVATSAMNQGFLPDTISTDLHGQSIMIPQSDMPNCISKMMLLGMTLSDAILRSTVNPAKAIRRFPEAGTLSAGQIADVAVLDVKTGVFAFKDAWGKKRLGNLRVECVLTVRNGNIVYDQNGLSFPLSSAAND
jgi:dihydroorotase